MRIQNSVRNLSAAWLGQVAMLLIKFVARTFFVIYLGKIYLGLNGLFSNILSMLSLAELGVGSAIVYSLYKPIACDDKNDLISIMQLYKKIYIIIGTFILVVGSSLTPFLSFFVKDLPNISNIELIYILFVVNASISYFFSYKSTFVIANQKNYVTTINHLAYYILTNVIQIIILITLQNFVLFLTIQIIMTFLENFTVSRIANRMYPILTHKEKIPLKGEVKKEILKNTGAMVFHKLGSIIVFSTDNLVLSKMIGLVSVGIYSNYSMIIAALDGILVQLFAAITASVGNLRVTASEEKQKKVFYATFFVNFYLYTFCAICLASLLNPVISLWFGRDFVFDKLIIFVLALNFYLTGMRKSVITFKDAFGLFWQNRYMPIFESAVNLICSIILVNIFGVIGVFIGTSISTIVTCVWIEPWVLFGFGFKSSSKPYFKLYFKYLIIMLIASFITLNITSLIVGEGIGYLLVNGIVCFIIVNSIIYVLFHKSEEFSVIRGYIHSLINSMKTKLLKEKI